MTDVRELHKEWMKDPEYRGGLWLLRSRSSS